jgi:proline racemase
MRFSNLITAVDAHACGEPGRVITGGILDVPGATMFQKMQYFAKHHDHIRLRMLREPRGYPAANCNILFPPTHPGAHAGYIIMEQVEYPPMSGTNTICVVTVLIETGMVPVTEPITNLLLETPAGLIAIEAQVQNGKATKVTFRNVPAFATHLDAKIEVPTLGTVTVDVAWGGMFYVIADAAPFGLTLTPNEAGETARIAELIKEAAKQQLQVTHPDNPDITGISIAELTLGNKNNVVVSTGTLGCLDRSPCGTGTCARMAVLHAKGILPLHQDFIHEGVLGTTFIGRLVEETQIGPYKAVVPTLSGQAWITGFSQYVLDPTDPFPEGFTVGDIWGRTESSEPRAQASGF